MVQKRESFIYENLVEDVRKHLAKHEITSEERERYIFYHSCIGSSPELDLPGELSIENYFRNCFEGLKRNRRIEYKYIDEHEMDESEK